MKNLRIFNMLVVLLSCSVQLSAKKMSEDDLKQVIDLITANEVDLKQKEEIQTALVRSYSEKSIKRKSLEPDECPSSPPPKCRINRDLGEGVKLMCSPGAQKGDNFAANSHDYNVVYAHMLTMDGRPLIPRNDRIEFPKLLGEDAKGKSIKITEKNLDYALLKIENKIRNWIHENENIYYHTTYVGLADNLAHRASGHSVDLGQGKKQIDKKKRFAKTKRAAKKKGFYLPSVETDEDTEEESEDEIDEEKIIDGIIYSSSEYHLIPFNAGKKVRFTMMAKDFLHSHVRMSPLVCQIPKKWMPLVEVLVGHLFNSISKAGTLLGNGDASERFEKYMNSDVRRGEWSGECDLERETGVCFPGEIERKHLRTMMHLLGMNRKKK